MILVFGGTTEGRIALKVLDEGEGSYFYSTKGNNQKVECLRGCHITGEMDPEKMHDFCVEHDIRLIIDAAHPFATELHKTIADIADALGLPVIRYERRYPDIPGSAILCDNYEDAVKNLKREGVKRLLALTGVQTIGKLKDFWKDTITYFRILNREDSLEKAEREGFSPERLVFYEKDNTGTLIERIKPDAIITKESGASGGFIEKIDVARENGLKLFIIRRPKTPETFIYVDGPHGLRREIERITPDFYRLHTGLTTGSCATAAAKAALIGLLTGESLKEISFKIPDGETMRMEVESVEIEDCRVKATVIKDAGDDPDVTDKSRISAEVRVVEGSGIRFSGGKGIGIVTLPGLGIEVGEPAINPVPRKMIEHELRGLYDGGLEVEISVENGANLAEKTFNPRVGITGGISIIGTSGIVRPFSHEAFIESIKRQMEVAIESKSKKIVLNSGGKSENFMKALYPDLPSHSFIHYGNAIGETITIAEEKGIESLAIGIMPGKAVKVAEGHLDTHSHKVTFSKDFLKQIAFKAGCNEATIRQIGEINLARELADSLGGEEREKLFISIAYLCHENCKGLFSNPLEIIIVSESGEILAKVS